MTTQHVPVHLLSKKEQTRLVKAGIIQPIIDPMADVKRDFFNLCMDSKTVSKQDMATICNVTLTTFNTYLALQDRRWELIDRFYNATRPRQRDVTLMMNIFRKVAKQAQIGITNE